MTTANTSDRAGQKRTDSLTCPVVEGCPAASTGSRLGQEGMAGWTNLVRGSCPPLMLRTWFAKLSPTRPAPGPRAGIERRKPCRPCSALEPGWAAASSRSSPEIGRSVARSGYGWAEPEAQPGKTGKTGNSGNSGNSRWPMSQGWNPEKFPSQQAPYHPAKEGIE